MGLDVTPIGQVRFDDAVADAPRARPHAVFDAATISSGDVPASPPPEVLEAMDVAARRYDELQAQGRELRFGLSGGAVTVEVCDVDGTVLSTLPASRVLDVATGAPLD